MTKKCRDEDATDEELARKIESCEKRVESIRIFGIIFLAGISAGFVSFALYLSSHSPSLVADSVPILIAGIVMAIVFAIGMAWCPWADVKSWISRIELLLRWQVTSGLLIAFTISLEVRTGLQGPILFVGLFFTFQIFNFGTFSLVALKLRNLYQISDRREDKRRQEGLFKKLKQELVYQIGQEMSSQRSRVTKEKKSLLSCLFGK